MKDDLQFQHPHDTSTAATGMAAISEDDPLMRPEDDLQSPTAGPAYLAIVIGLSASAVTSLLLAVLWYIDWNRSRVCFQNYGKAQKIVKGIFWKMPFSYEKRILF
jgi:hypothetical protein